MGRGGRDTATPRRVPETKNQAQNLAAFVRPFARACLHIRGMRNSVSHFHVFMKTANPAPIDPLQGTGEGATPPPLSRAPPASSPASWRLLHLPAPHCPQLA